MRAVNGVVMDPRSEEKAEEKLNRKLVDYKLNH